MTDETKTGNGGEGLYANANANANANFTMWKPKQYRCPVHGVTEHNITSFLKGHEGVWCQVCWLDALDKIGVHRMTEVEATDG